MELAQLGGNLLVVSLLFFVFLSDRSVEKIFDHLLLINVEDVLEFLVLVKKGLRCNLVLLEHGLDLSTGLLDPGEVGIKIETCLFETWLVW